MYSWAFRLLTAALVLLVCIVQVALISTVSGYLVISIPLLLMVIWYLQRFYLSTSRQLRLLDLEHKSPLYSSLMETVDGLAIIRAFGWTAAFEHLFISRLDESQRPVYFLYCIQRWLNLVLDLIIAALATLLIILATQLRGTSSSSGGALFGVAIVSMIGFSQNLGQFIFFYTELETSLGAITRIMEYSAIQPEDEPASDQKSSLPENWPSNGSIRFEKVSLRYKYVAHLSI
jgi:ATP-binding cassette, subfamily C (CFTR/MRP), member 1